MIFEDVANPPSAQGSTETEEESEDVETQNSEDVKTETPETTSDRKTVLQIWRGVPFEEGEENKWKVELKKANEIANKVEEGQDTPKTDEDMKERVEADTDVRDRVIAIANLFGKAYRLYKHDTIPSNRPLGKISMKTYQLKLIH